MKQLSRSYLIIGLFIFSSCLFPTAQQKKALTNGRFIAHLYLLDSTGDLHLHAMNKIWFTKSKMIEEISETVVERDFTKGNKPKITRSAHVKHYIYLDPIKQDFLVFKHFADTALPITPHLGIDSFKVYNAFNYYSDNFALLDDPAPVSDTVIMGKVFKRVKYHTVQTGPASAYGIGYLLCDEKFVPFSFLKKYSRQTGCVVLKEEVYKIGRTLPTIISELEFQSEKLTDEELKIFKAWEKY